jgi:hypothetical protein
MQLPEKYKENFDVSSEGLSQGRSEEDNEGGCNIPFADNISVAN